MIFCFNTWLYLFLKNLYFVYLQYYSVGVLLWKTAELKKLHSDFDSDKLGLMDIVNGIRDHMWEGYYEPFSNDVPSEWQYIVSKGEHLK